MKKRNLNKLPLDGIIILDLTSVLSGPYATLILSDLGANVIKVEKPSGDDSRGFGPFINNESGYFISLNRGKKSIVLDLKDKKDKKMFWTLLSKVDVLIDNYKPRTLERLGFNWETISKKFPKLIYTKISGFGETGPLKDLPAYDIVVQAMGGIMSITGNRKNNFVRVGTSIGDIVAGLFSVIGVLSQLIRRKNTKLGSKLDISMLDCQVAILENAVSRFSIEKKNPTPLGTDHPSIAPFGSFNTLDGSIVIAAGNEKIFSRFCKVIDDKEMSTNPLFINNECRNKNLTKLRRRVESKLRTKSSSYWQKEMSKNKIPCSLVNNIEDVINHPQVLERNMILNYNHRSVKNLKISGNPIKFNFHKYTNKAKKSPKLDENKKEILKFFKLV